MNKGKFLVVLIAALLITFTYQGVAKACCLPQFPPVISNITADPGVLWPPNHKMVPVALTVSGSNIGNWWVSGVSYLDVGKGAGDPTNDPDFSFSGQYLELRAERGGPGDGRGYWVSVTAVNPQGTLYASSAVPVGVPHDMMGGQGKDFAPGQNK